MKKRTYYFSILLLLLIVGLNSCTLKKRTYQPGYYVDWHNVNKKSKSETESLSRQKQKAVSNEEIVAKNSFDEIKGFNQPTDNQEIELVLSSADESINNVEIINKSNQKKSFNYETKKEEIEENATLRKKNTSKSSGNNNNDLPVYFGATSGLVLSILSVLFYVGAYYSESIIIGLFLLLLPSFIFAILGVVFSILSIIIILKNQDKYSGLWIAIAGLGVFLVFVFLILSI